jgi:hypothetical protein
MKALLLTLIAVATFGILVLLYMAEVGTDVFLAIIEAVTPPDG